MKVLVINCNPKIESSLARWFYDPFLNGLAHSGFEVEKVYLSRKVINPCKGCLNCWYVEKGKCIFDDDFDSIQRKQLNSDYIIYVAPVYAGTFPSMAFNLTQRSISILKPTFELYNGHFGHQILFNQNIKGIGVISWCSFFEKDNFNSIDEYLKALSNIYSTQYAINIFRPHIIYFSFYPGEKEKFANMMFEAGCFFSKNGYLPKIMKTNIEKETIDRDTYLKMTNQYLSDKTNNL